jgi:hypothetical protein
MLLAEAGFALLLKETEILYKWLNHPMLAAQ